MLSFFDSFTSFISTIWGYFQNLFELTIELFSFIGTMYAGIGVLSTVLPSIISMGFLVTTGVMLVRFILMK